MAYAILKGLGAPSEVSSATLDAAAAKAITSEQCRISNVSGSSAGLEFDRLDDGLPFNQGLFFNLHYFIVPFPEELNRYMLTVTHLDPGKYTITANGRGLGSFSAEQLAAGVNIASATADPWQPGGPWDAQGWSLNYLTEARNQNAEVEKFRDQYLKTNPNRKAILSQVATINEQLERAQRAVAKPATYHFVVRPAGK
jgi:hypothetical protein